MKYKTVEIDFPEALIPENAEELIRRLENTDNRTVAQKARKEEDNGDFSPGLIKAVKEAIQLYNRLNSSAGRTAKDARMSVKAKKEETNVTAVVKIEPFKGEDAVVVRIRGEVARAFFIRENRTSADYHRYLVELAQTGYKIKFL